MVDLFIIAVSAKDIMAEIYVYFSSSKGCYDGE